MGTSKRKTNFNILRLSHVDLELAGYNSKLANDDVMHRMADFIGGWHQEGAFAALIQLAEGAGIPKHVKSQKRIKSVQGQFRLKIKNTMSSSLTFNTEAFGKVYVKFGNYPNGALAVQLLDSEGQPVADLSVNLVNESPALQPDEFVVKTWSENEQIAFEAYYSGHFEDTGKKIGFIQAPVWKIRKKAPSNAK